MLSHTETTVIPKSTLGKCFKIFDEVCSCPWVSEDALRTKRPKLLTNFVPKFSLLVGENPGNEVDSYPDQGNITTYPCPLDIPSCALTI